MIINIEEAFILRHLVLKELEEYNDCTEDYKNLLIDLLDKIKNMICDHDKFEIKDGDKEWN